MDIIFDVLSRGVGQLLGRASGPFHYLLSWQGSFAGSDDCADVNLGGFQPFLFYQLGDGTYLRSSAVCVYNFENSDYSMTAICYETLNMFGRLHAGCV